MPVNPTYQQGNPNFSAQSTQNDLSVFNDTAKTNPVQTEATTASNSTTSSRSSLGSSNGSISGLSNSFKFQLPTNPLSTLKQDLKFNLPLPNQNATPRLPFVRSEPNYLPSQTLRQQFTASKLLNTPTTASASSQILANQMPAAQPIQTATTPSVIPALTTTLSQPTTSQQQQQGQQQQLQQLPIPSTPTFQAPERPLARKRGLLRHSVDSFKPVIALNKPIERDTSYDSDTHDTPDEQNNSLLSNLAKRLNSQFGGPLDSPPTSPFANLKSDINNLKKIKVVSPSIPPTQPHNISPLSVSPLTMATDSHTQNPLFTIPTERPLGFFVVDILGSASFDGKLIPKDEVRIVRNRQPLNETAIRIETPFQKAIGYLPDNITQWLAPLLDMKKIRVEGKLPGYILPGHDTQIVINAYLPPSSHLSFLDQEERKLWIPLADSLKIQLGDIFAPMRKSSVNDISVVDLTEEQMNREKQMKRSGSHDISINIDPKKLKTENENSTIPYRDPTSIEMPEDLQLERLYRSLSSMTKSLKEMDPPKTMKVELRSYQKQALGWMVERESTPVTETKAPVSVPYPWTQYETNTGKKYYFNRETKETCWELPPQYLLHEKQDLAVKGGILADEMGMGKTIEILSLLMTNRPEKPTAGGLTSIPDGSNLSDGSDSSPIRMEDSPSPPNVSVESEKELVPSKTNLIVCPLSLMNQWQEEIKKHIDPSLNLSIYCYHGTNRNRDPVFLASHDVVLTTYSTLAAEIPPENSKSLKRPQKTDQPALLYVNWFRVVLDEAHTIKDRNTRTAKAAFALKAERRWCVTGTPIQNKLDDVFSLLHFLHVEPYCEYAWWSKVIMKPIKNKDDRGFSRLQTILDNILLRRTKDQKLEDGKAIVALPPKTIHLKAVEFSKEEDDFYQSLWNSSKTQFDDLVATGTLMENYAHVLELLLRLRQSCDHPHLVTSKKDKQSKSKSLKHLLSLISESTASSDLAGKVTEFVTTGGVDLTDEECSLCLESIESPVMTHCAHLFCKSCINHHIASDFSKGCPVCRKPISVEELIELPKSCIKGKSSKIDMEKESNKWRGSSKINALMNDLKVMSENDPTIKTIVFSQWTSMLDLVEIPLKNAGYKFVRLDGSMNNQQREKSINTFKEDPDVKIFLISMKAGGLGLNLTVASTVFLLDPWWNPATEDQAIDRVHRLGQTRDVVITRFVIKNSIEERILELQERKKMLAQGALGMSNKELRQVRFEELRQLFRE